MAFGEATNAQHLARHLSDAGLEVHVLTREFDNSSADAGITLHPIMPDWTWARIHKVRKFLRVLRPDAILQLHLGGIYDLHPMMTFLSKRHVITI